MDGKWFIAKNSEVRFVLAVIRKDIEFDYTVSSLVVSMDNNLNQPCLSNCKLEEIDHDEQLYISKKDAQIEIIRRERFGNK